MCNLLYDTEFEEFLRIAKRMVPRIKDKADRQICTKWIKKLCNLRSNDAGVKKNRNDFFRYLLEVIQRSLLNDAKNQTGWETCGGGQDTQDQREDSKLDSFGSHWSEDRRTYVACKTIPGVGTLIYMAVSTDPDLGWDFPGKRRSIRQ